GRAYDLIMGGAEEPFLGIVINYPQQRNYCQHIELSPRNLRARFHRQTENLGIGLLGAGNFALGILIPAIRGIPRAELIGVCAASGLSAHYAAKKFGFLYSTTDPQKILEETEVNTVVIATPHRMHASLIIAALAARKNVFCEKPLCTSEAELADI